MSEKDLIRYLLVKKVFVTYEKALMNTIANSIINSIDRSKFIFYKTYQNTKILYDMFEEDELKEFIETIISLCIKQIAESNNIILESKEINLDVLNKELSNRDYNSILSELRNLDIELIKSLIEIDEQKLQVIKIKYLYEYFYNQENLDTDIRNFANSISTDVTNKKNIKLKGLTFDNVAYKNIFNRFVNITFLECTFKNVDTLNLISNRDISLKFDKCYILEDFDHIFCKSIIFDSCPIIENYKYINLSEDRIPIVKLLFTNSNINKLELEGVEFDYNLFKNNNNIDEEYKYIKSLILKNCEFKKNFIIDISDREDDESENYKRFKIDEIDLTNSVFKNGAKVKIQFCDIDIANFYNTKFQDLADFYQSKFEKVNFERTDFEDVCVFSETEFNCNIDFKYTKFLGNTIFRDTTFSNKLNFRNSIFDDDVNFLDITSKKREKDKNTKEFIGKTTDIKVSNRETARIIKSFFDKQNNTIEANKFYALEMKEREKELEKDIKEKKNFFEWIVFKTHGMTSNHSQNWLLALFWIIIFTFNYKFLNCISNEKSVNLLLFSIISFIVLFIIGNLIDNYKNDKGIHLTFMSMFIIVYYLLYGFTTKDWYLNLFSNNINPFSIMTEFSEMNFSTLIYKIIIGYLIYQLIISIRQNTRRN